MDNEKQKKISHLWGAWNLIEAILLMAAGALSIAAAILFTEGGGDQSPIQTVLAIVVGVFIAMDGVLRIVMVMTKQKKNPDSSIMLIGGFEITAGIVVAIMHKAFIDIIVNFLGVLLLVIGFLFVLFSIIMIARKNSPTFFMPIIEIVFGAILLAIGLTILILYYGSDIGMRNKVTLIVIGAVMAIAGLAQAIITGISLRKAKKANYAVPIEDVEVFDFEEEEKPHKDKKENKKLKKGDIIEIDSSEPKQIERKDK